MDAIVLTAGNGGSIPYRIRRMMDFLEERLVLPHVVRRAAEVLAIKGSAQGS